MKTTSKTKPSSQKDLNDLAAQVAVINPMAGAVCIASWLEIMTEGTRFASERFQRNLEVQRALLASKSVEEIMSVQAEFYRSAIEQYVNEVNRLADLVSKATAAATEEATASRARRYDDIPL